MMTQKHFRGSYLPISYYELSSKLKINYLLHQLQLTNFGKDLRKLIDKKLYLPSIIYLFR